MRLRTSAIALVFFAGTSSIPLSSEAVDVIYQDVPSQISPRRDDISHSKTKDLIDGIRNILDILSPPDQLTTNMCDTSVGDWWWDTRMFPVSIYPNGRILADDPASGGRISANWTCLDPSQGLVQIAWSTGITDLMRVIDQNRMSGDNGNTRVDAVRREAVTTTPPPVSARVPMDFDSYCRKTYADPSVGTNAWATLNGRTVYTWSCDQRFSNGQIRQHGIDVNQVCISQTGSPQHGFTNENEPNSWFCGD